MAFLVPIAWNIVRLQFVLISLGQERGRIVDPPLSLCLALDTPFGPGRALPLSSVIVNLASRLVGSLVINCIVLGSLLDEPSVI